MLFIHIKYYIYLVSHLVCENFSPTNLNISRILSLESCKCYLWTPKIYNSHWGRSQGCRMRPEEETWRYLHLSENNPSKQGAIIAQDPFVTPDSISRLQPIGQTMTSNFLLLLFSKQKCFSVQVKLYKVHQKRLTSDFNSSRGIYYLFLGAYKTKSIQRCPKRKWLFWNCHTCAYNGFNFDTHKLLYTSETGVHIQNKCYTVWLQFSFNQRTILVFILINPPFSNQFKTAENTTRESSTYHFLTETDNTGF